jgi:hypothetical protein
LLASPSAVNGGKNGDNLAGTVLSLATHM